MLGIKLLLILPLVVSDNLKLTNEGPRQYLTMEDGDCSKYIMYQNGKGTVMNCPHGLAFNVEISICDWHENVPLCNLHACINKTYRQTITQLYGPKLAPQAPQLEPVQRPESVAQPDLFPQPKPLPELIPEPIQRLIPESNPQPQPMPQPQSSPKPRSRPGSKEIACQEGKATVMNCPYGSNTVKGNCNVGTSCCDWPENVPLCNLHVPYSGLGVIPVTPGPGQITPGLPAIEASLVPEPGSAPQIESVQRPESVAQPDLFPQPKPLPELIPEPIQRLIPESNPQPQPMPQPQSSPKPRCRPGRKDIACQEGKATVMNCPYGSNTVKGNCNVGTSCCDWPENVPLCNHHVPYSGLGVIPVTPGPGQITPGLPAIEASPVPEPGSAPQVEPVQRPESVAQPDLFPQPKPLPELIPEPIQRLIPESNPQPQPMPQPQSSPKPRCRPERKDIACQEGKATIMNCPYGSNTVKGYCNVGTSCCDWPENVPLCNHHVPYSGLGVIPVTPEPGQITPGLPAIEASPVPEPGSAPQVEPVQRPESVAQPDLFPQPKSLPELIPEPIQRLIPESNPQPQPMPQAQSSPKPRCRPERKDIACQEGKATVMNCPYGSNTVKGNCNVGTSCCDWPENVPLCNHHVRSQATGVGYYGTSNVRNQGLSRRPIDRPRPLPQLRRTPTQCVASTQCPATNPATALATLRPVPPHPVYIQTSRPLLLPRPFGPIVQPAPSSEPLPFPELIPEPIQQLIPESSRQPQPMPQYESVHGGHKKITILTMNPVGNDHASAFTENPKVTNECPRQYGYFSMKDGDCSKYIVCQDGKATVMNCPHGLAFNVETSNCDWPENMPLCNLYAFKDFKCPATDEDLQDGKISDFIYKYRYGGQCKQYVACQRGHPRLLSCDPGLLFDEPSQTCIDEDFVTNCAAS